MKLYLNIRVNVQNASGGSQNPKELIKFTGDFYFVHDVSILSENNLVNINSEPEEVILNLEINYGSVSIDSEISGD